MKKVFALFIIFSTVACAQVAVKKEITEVIRPGEVRFISFPVPQNKAKLYCRGNEISYHVQEDKALAIIVSSYFSQLEPFTCRVQIDSNNLYEMNFLVKHREYKAEVLKVNPKTIKLSPEDQARADREQIMLNQIYAESAREFLFSQTFMGPMNTQVTSLYGTRRVYNKKKKGQHLGIDYRAFVGDKVPATNKGKVVFAGDLFYTGGTVIIDHGLDIFSVYGHLSKTLVDAGQMVEKGQLIALSGNTGRTSGPHLHWGVKVQGQYIDGFVLIEESKKYYLD